MKFRKANFLDLYAEKLAVVIAAVFVAIVGVLFFFTNVYVVQIPGTPEPVSFADVGPRLTDRASNLQRQLNVEPEVVARIRGIQTEHADVFAARIRPADVEAFSQTRLAALGLTPARVEIEGRRRPVFERFVVPPPPAPRITDVRVGNHHRIDMDLGPEMTQAVSAAVPQRDFRAVHIRAEWDQASWQKLMDTEPEAGTPLPPSWRRPALLVTDVLVQRQKLDPDTGEWGRVETLGKLPTVPPEMNFRDRNREMTAQEAGQSRRIIEENQEAIRIPFFIPTKLPWPLETIQIDVADARLLEQVRREITSTTDRINNPRTTEESRSRLREQRNTQVELIARELERITQVPWPNQPEPYTPLPAQSFQLSMLIPGATDEPRQRFDEPRPPSGPGRPGTRPDGPGQPGNIWDEDEFGMNSHAPGTVLISAGPSRGGSIWDEDEFGQPSRQPGQRPGMAPPPTPRQPGQLAPPAFPGDRGGWGQQPPMIEPGMDPQADIGLPTNLEVWGHDINVQPGATYRYRILVGVFNPLFRQPNLHEEQAHMRNEITLLSTPSPWSDPVVVEPELYVFLTQVPRDQAATFEVWRNVNSIWRNREFANVSPGSVVGDFSTIEGRRVSLRSQEIVVDITSGRERVLVTDLTGTRLRERTVDESASVRVRLLQIQKIMEMVRQTVTQEAQAAF